MGSDGAAPWPVLRVWVKRVRDAIVVTGVGRVDPREIPSICARVRTLLGADAGSAILCDLSALPRADAVTVELLARLELTARRHGSRLWVWKVSDELRELLHFSGLGEILLQDAMSFRCPYGSNQQRKRAKGGPMAGRVVHFEVMTNKEAGELRSFYSDLFGWNIDTNEEFNYGMVDGAQAGIGGGIGGLPDPNIPGHVTFYVEVPDLEATLGQAESRGGSRLMGPEEIMPGTTIALFQDPHGNTIGLIKGE